MAHPGAPPQTEGALGPFPVVSGPEVQRRSSRLSRKPRKHLKRCTQGQGVLALLSCPAPRTSWLLETEPPLPRPSAALGFSSHALSPWAIIYYFLLHGVSETRLL